MAALALLLLVLCEESAAQAAEPVATATAPSASQPATRPAGAVVYQPGVSIDWTSRQVLIAGEVVLRSGDLELFACSPGTKEHESIVRVHARPLHIFQALGLLGFEPGHPPYYDNDHKKVVPAEGERLDISVRWTQDGRTKTVPIEQWMQGRDKAAPAAIDWVLSGSMTLEDGRLLADVDGTVLCVVDFDGAIISVAGSHSSSNAELWLSANTDQIPPTQTPVTLIVQAARPRLVFQIDRFGRLRQAGQPSSLRQWVQAARQASETPGGASAILQHDPAVPDIQVRELASALRQAGLAEVTAQPVEAQPGTANGPIAPSVVEGEDLAILQTLAGLGQQLPSAIDAAAKSLKDTYSAFSERINAAGHAAAGAARALGTVQGASRPAPSQ